MFSGKLIQHYSRFILNKILPPMCVLCGYSTRRAINICYACQEDLAILAPILSQTCYQCAQFLLGESNADKICGLCFKKPPPFDRTNALFAYQAPVIKIIIALKFQQQLSHAKLLGDLITQKIQNEWYENMALPDVIIPIPLHLKRLRERGFNQALEIARPIAKTLSIPIDSDGITRIKNTTAQSGLPANLRQQNIRHAFASNCHYSGLNVAVIDDVISTGYTMAECCRLIKKNGAKRIDVWCCARNDIALRSIT